MNYKFLISFIFLAAFIRTTSANITPTNGQAVQQIPLIRGIVSLVYQGAISRDINNRNDVVSSSWVGLGWRLGFPSIFVAHNNTVDINDDRWFYEDGNGGGSEIVRVVEDISGTKEESFYLTNSRYSRVRAIDNNPTSGQLRIIKGWEITDASGNISRFGYVQGLAEDAMRYIPSWGNEISPGIAGSIIQPSKFYYRWDLKTAETQSGLRGVYSYSQSERSTNTGYAYTAQSYISSILLPSGNSIAFTLDPALKSTNEGPVEPVNEEFDFTENRFLRTITWTNTRENAVLDQISFKYSGDEGEAAHLYANQKGYAKRLLTKVIFTNNKAENRDLSYFSETSPFAGKLNAISFPMRGGSLTYDYAKMQVNEDLIEDVQISATSVSYPTTAQLNDKASMLSKYRYAKPIRNPGIVVGNHIYLLNYTITPAGETTSVKIDVVDRIRNSWGKVTVPGVTDYVIPNARCSIWPDRLIILQKELYADNTFKDHVCFVYEYLDDRWVQTFKRYFQSSDGSSFGNTNVEIYQQQGYFALFEPQKMIVYIFNKIGNSWTSTFNAPAATDHQYNDIQDDYGRDHNGEGWNWPDVSIGSETQVKHFYAMPGYFMFTYRYKYPQWTYASIVAEIFRYNGQGSWYHTEVSGIVQPGGSSLYRFTANGYQYRFSDVLMQDATENEPNVAVAMPSANYYCVCKNPTGEPRCYIAIRRFDPATGAWLAEKFENTNGLTYSSDNNAYEQQKIIRWPRNLQLYNSDDYMILQEVDRLDLAAIYRYRNLGSTWGWTPTYISGSPIAYSPDHMVNGSPFGYAKDFAAIIVPFICTPQYFIARGTSNLAPKNYFWVFRWNESIGEWKSCFNAAESGNEDGEADSYSQGYNFANYIHDIYSNDEHIGIMLNGAAEEDAQNADRIIKIWKYDFNNENYGTITSPWVDETFTTCATTKRFSISDMYWLEHYSSYTTQTDMQGLKIRNRCIDMWEGKPTVDVQAISPYPAALPRVRMTLISICMPLPAAISSLVYRR